ncbi:MAG: 50S ribosomal protein L1 [Candidatus Nezhaarchaeota archaeon]|nr:50S ribosomal protein L1 [Candidatus Nezhaarchaeota archaeon]
MTVGLDALRRAIEEAKREAKPRKFRQSVELIVNVKDVSMKQPEAKLNEAIALPHVSKEGAAKVCVIAEGDMAIKARGVADMVIGKDEVAKAQGDKRYAKQLAKSFDFFIAQADLMPLIGRALGPALGPRGKMPTPLPSTADPAPLVKKLQSSVRVRMKDVPVIQCSIGFEDMPTEELAENAKAVIDSIEEKLKIPHRLGDVYVKLTMSPPVRVKAD